MKHNTLIISILLLILLIACSTNTKKQEQQLNNDIQTVDSTKNQLRHLVLFKFYDDVSTDSIIVVQKAFSSLPSKIPEIKDFEWGIDVSVEDLHKDFTHAFLITFGSLEDRAIYLPHPDHQEFVEMLTPKLEDVMVLDYWAER